VVASGAVTLSTFASRLAGPAGSLILICRSKENLTSLESRVCPLAHFRPDLSLTVYSVGDVKEADSARSGTGSAPPGLELSRKE